MKVLLISREFPPSVLGGTATVAANTCKGLVSLGNEVQVVTAFSKYEKTFNNRIIVHSMDYKQIYQTKKESSLEFYRLIEKVVADFRPDCLVVPDIISFSESYAVSKVMKVPLLFICLQDFKNQSRFYSNIHFVSKNLGGNSRKLISYENAVLKKSKNTVFISKILQKDMSVLTLGNRHRMIYLGVDLDEIKKIKFQAKSKNQILISTCARLVPEKGVGYLIQAMPHILKVYPQIKLSIIGVGPEERNLKILCKNLNIVDSVIFHGEINRTEALEIMQHSQVGVVTSLWESFCYVAAEYMALGTSLVSTNAKSLEEICPPDSVNIIEPRFEQDEIIDVVLLAENIINRINDRTKKKTMEAKKYIQKKFSNEQYSLKLQSFLEEIIYEYKQL